MKLVGAVSVTLAAFGARSFADAVCCPSLKIIHATLTPNGEMQRRLAEDADCKDRRAGNINPFTDSTGDFWQLTGEDLEEDEFTRFVYDMAPTQNSYWSMTGGGGEVPPAQKVVAFTLADDANFGAGWDSTGASPDEECSDSTFTGGDLIDSLKDESKWFVLLPQGSVRQSWVDWVESGGYSSIASTMCGTGCNTVVGERTNGDLLNDIHTALEASLSLQTCEPCRATTTTEEPTTTTTTTTTEEPTEPATTTSTDQPTQLPTTEATTSGGRATIAIAAVLPSLIVSAVGVAAVLF